MKTHSLLKPLQQGARGFALLFIWAMTHAEDWPMFGRDQTRNPVSPEKGAPVEWDIKTGRNIKWRARLGSISTSQPIVSGGLIWIGTNNDQPRDPSRKARGGVLACFRERDGGFLYDQLFTTTNNWLNRRAEFGMPGSAFADQDRLWFASPLAEILCLDTAPLHRGEGTPQTIWRIDMVSQLGIFPAVDIMGGRGVCSLGASWGDLIFVITGNGVDWTRQNVPAPNAPALVCVNKTTGKVLWEDHSPGTNILFGEFASPLVMEAGGVAQVIAPQGDGWVRSFQAQTGKLLWKFDINLKATQESQKQNVFQRMQRQNFFLNSPVMAGGRIFLAGGRDVEAGEGPGRLVCVDPTRRGDLSLELEEVPNRGQPNPNTGAIWNFDEIHRTHGNVAVCNGLVVAVDFSGFLFCLDVATGRKLWKHDMKAHVWGSPLVVDGKIYVGDEDGNVGIFELAREKRLLFTAAFAAGVHASPIFANGVLYVATDEELFAIQTGASSSTPPKPAQP